MCYRNAALSAPDMFVDASCIMMRNLLIYYYFCVCVRHVLVWRRDGWRQLGQSMSSMFPEMCQGLAASEALPYFALQQGACLGSSVFDPAGHDKVDDGYCSFACPGDSSKSCGSVHGHISAFIVDVAQQLDEQLTCRLGAGSVAEWAAPKLGCMQTPDCSSIPLPQGLSPLGAEG